MQSVGSLASAVWFALIASSGYSVSRIVWALLLTAGQYYVVQYMRSFWSKKVNVPMMDGYNEAISDSLSVASLLDALWIAWGILAVLSVVGI